MQIGVGAVVLFGLVQLVPYGRSHSSPPVVEEPKWDSPETRALAVRACFNCHSNETRWPWYSHVAPVSWLVFHDVDEGRDILNLSEWNRTWKQAEKASDEVSEGEMPPFYYTPLHAEARLTDEERAALARGLEWSLRTDSWQ